MTMGDLPPCMCGGHPSSMNILLQGGVNLAVGHGGRRRSWRTQPRNCEASARLGLRRGPPEQLALALVPHNDRRDMQGTGPVPSLLDSCWV